MRKFYCNRFNTADKSKIAACGIRRNNETCKGCGFNSIEDERRKKMIDGGRGLKWDAESRTNRLFINRD